MVDETGIARIHPLQPGFRTVLLPEPPPLPADLAAAVDSLWTVEKAARGDRLFDGVALCLSDHAPDCLTLLPRRYRHALAARRRPELRPALRASPTGVIGLVSCRDGLLIGRRARHLAAAPGRWEPAPAGTLDQPDPEAVLVAELAEELGLAGADIGRPLPLALVHDVAQDVHDIIFTVACPLDAAAVRRAHAGAPHHDEYDELAILPDAAIAAFLRREAATIRAVMPAILRYAGFAVD